MECDDMVSYGYENSFRTTLLCIDDYTNKIMRGRIYNPHLPNGIEFVGVMDLLLQMEKMFEDLKCPQAFSSLRTFRPGTGERNAPTEASKDIREGTVATFSLRILFRQNSSWQGSLMWHEGKTEEPFRSVLELLMLMDSALAIEPVT